MKTLKILVTIALLTVLTGSCVFDGIKGNRNVTMEERDINADFDALKASQGLKVYLTLEKDFSVKVEADENLQDIIIAEVEDGVLHLYTKKNIWTAKSRKVYVSMPEISKIATTSGAEVYSQGLIQADDLRLDATSGSDIDLKLQVNNLTCETSSGADIRLSGKAADFKARSSSGSDIKAGDLITETCEASVSSGADIYVNVTGSLIASASSGGNIKYAGHPHSTEQNSNSSGSIRKIGD